MGETLSQIVRTLEPGETLTFTRYEHAPNICASTDIKVEDSVIRSISVVIGVSELENVKFDVLATEVRRLLQIARGEEASKMGQRDTCFGCRHLHSCSDSAGGGRYLCDLSSGLVVGEYGHWTDPEIDGPKACDQYNPIRKTMEE